jgi:hypothetical protein
MFTSVPHIMKCLVKYKTDTYQQYCIWISEGRAQGGREGKRRESLRFWCLRFEDVLVPTNGTVRHRARYYIFGSGRASLARQTCLWLCCISRRCSPPLRHSSCLEDSSINAVFTNQIYRLARETDVVGRQGNTHAASSPSPRPAAGLIARQSTRQYKYCMQW